MSNIIKRKHRIMKSSDVCMLFSLVSIKFSQQLTWPFTIMKKLSASSSVNDPIICIHRLFIFLMLIIIVIDCCLVQCEISKNLNQISSESLHQFKGRSTSLKALFGHDGNEDAENEQHESIGFKKLNSPISSHADSPLAVTDGTDRWHTVSAYVGSEITLPCAIDVTGCGRIYFITFTKNVTIEKKEDLVNRVSSSSSSSGNIFSQGVSSSSGNKPPRPPGATTLNNGEWQRVFIHSESFQRVMGDLEANSHGKRVRFGPKDFSKSNFAQLTIESVVAQDEGLYRCDVTYVTPHAHGKCPSLTYIRVQTLVRPSSPLIKINGRTLAQYKQDKVEVSSKSSAKSPSSPETLFESDESSKNQDIEMFRDRQIGPFKEGDTIVFECSTFGGRPMPELRWFNGSRPLRSKITITDLETEQNFDLINKDNPQPFTEQAHQSWKKLDQAEEAQRLNVRRRVVATTKIIANRYDLGAKFECRVVWNNTIDENVNDERHSSSSSTLNKTSIIREWLLLDIQVRPLTIRVDSPRLPVQSSETVIIRCTVDGARPSANITWYNRSEVVQAETMTDLQQLISSSSSSGGEQLKTQHHPSSMIARTRITTELMTDGTYRTTSLLAFVATRHDHQAEFFCKGSNQVLRDRNEVPLLQGVQIQVQYPPVVAIEPDGLIAVNESSSIQLWCTYDANPINLTEIIWYKDRRPITFDHQWSESNAIASSKLWSNQDERGTPTLTINDIDRNDSAEYSCRIGNQHGHGYSITTARLEVAYPPVVMLDIIEPANQILEQRSDQPLPQIRLRCSTIMGQPRQLIAVQWYRNGRHFLNTVSFKHLQQSKQAKQSAAHQSSSMLAQQQTTPTLLSHSFLHRVNLRLDQQHFDDESTPLSGPVNGQFLLNNNLNDQPYVHYLDEPHLLFIENVTKDLSGNYSCLGFNGATNSSRISSEKNISVKYPPGQASLTLVNENQVDFSAKSTFVLRGSQALLECRVDEPGNPSANRIIWLHNGVRLEGATSHFNVEQSKMSPLIARLRTPKADLVTSGEYRCLAINDLGYGEAGKFLLDVKSPPRLLKPDLPSTIGALSNQSLTVTCLIECHPLCSIQWLHNNITRLTSIDGRGIVHSSTTEGQYQAKLRNGNDLEFTIKISHHESMPNAHTTNNQGPSNQSHSYTVSQLHVLNTTALFDFDHLTCVSQSEIDLGQPVFSTTVFRREYAPHTVHLSVPALDLLEGEGYPEKPILCTAFGHPAPRYYWTFEPFTETSRIGSSNHLDTTRYNETIVVIGPRLTLDQSTSDLARKRQPSSSSAMKQRSALRSDARVANKQHQESGRFHATRSLSGNYTCVAVNSHGSATAVLSINVFYRPDCDLRRINSAKVFRQKSSTHLNSQFEEFNKQESASTADDNVPMLLSCLGVSNPAPAKFSWFRRAGNSSSSSEMIEIHPSVNSDHSLFIAIQDYDYGTSDSGPTYSSNHLVSSTKEDIYQNDPALASSSAHEHKAHLRQNVVMSVPFDVDLHEYACVVSNAIGESAPCWFQENPTSDLISSSSGDESSDSFMLMAASTCVIVFCVLLVSITSLVFFCNRNRTRFKDFASSGASSGASTPQRFKLDRPTNLLMMDKNSENLIEDFLLDARSKTATLSAAYRMSGAANSNGIAVGTLKGGSSSYRIASTHNNPYSSASSVYGCRPADNMHPFLVSAYSPNNVYAEPEYSINNNESGGGGGCGGGLSSTGTDQLTGSTNLTTASTNFHQTSQLQASSNKKFHPHSTNDNEDADFSSHCDYNDDNYEVVKEPIRFSDSSLKKSSSSKHQKRKKKVRRRRQTNSNKSMKPISSSSSNEDSHTDDEEEEIGNKSDEEISNNMLRNFDKPQTETTTSNNRKDSLNGSVDDEISIRSTAYNPDRDFSIFSSSSNQQTAAPKIFHHNNTTFMMPSMISENGSITKLPKLRMTSNQGGHIVDNRDRYGSLLRQHSNSSSNIVPPSPRFTQQYHQSPVSTRIYFNFDQPPPPPLPPPQHPMASLSRKPPPFSYYNSLRYNNHHNGQI